MRKILILFAHPAINKSRINKKLTEAVRSLEGVTLNDLYENYPDFFIDIKKEQNLLLAHDIIVWQHPFYWYSSPSIIKEWMDLVLEHGFAYGIKGKALEGKSAMSVISTGGGGEVYSAKGTYHYSVNQFLVPFRQSVELCRMNWLPPFVIYGSHTIQEEEIESAAQSYLEIINMLRDDKTDLKKLLKMEYFNDLVK